MVTIISTIIVCITILLCVNIIAKVCKDILIPTQQPMITEEDLDKAYKENPNIPDFQKVIEFINTEFSGVNAEDYNE